MTKKWKRIGAILSLVLTILYIISSVDNMIKAQSNQDKTSVYISIIVGIAFLAGSVTYTIHNNVALLRGHTLKDNKNL